MKYKCIANPHCLKTFDFGHALRAHIASCENAQRILQSKADIDKLETQIALDYPGIYGLHRNTYFPTAHGLDETKKFYFTDKYRFTPNDGKLKAEYKPHKKSVRSNIFESTQVKSALTFDNK